MLAKQRKFNTFQVLSLLDFKLYPYFTRIGRWSQLSASPTSRNSNIENIQIRQSSIQTATFKTTEPPIGRPFQMGRRAP